jgi:hypothetical protein
MAIFISFILGTLGGAITTFVFYSQEIRLGKALVVYADNLVGGAEDKATTILNFIHTKAQEAVDKL